MAKIPGIHTQRVEKLLLVSGNGFGSTNTAIRRFSTTKLSTLANLMTYTDSATLGASFTALKRVHVIATYSDVTAAGQSASQFGCAWTLNTTQPTLSADVITDGSLVADGMTRVESVNASMQGGGTTTYSGTMEIGDVLRAQPSAGGGGSFTSGSAKTLVSIVVTEVPV